MMANKTTPVTQEMIVFRGVVDGYESVATFGVSDLLSAVIEGDTLLTKSNLGETPVLIDTIEVEIQPEAQKWQKNQFYLVLR